MPISEPVHILHTHHLPECRARVHKHFDYFSIQFIASGRIRLSCDAETFSLKAGWIWFCYPGPLFQFHAQDPKEAWDHRYAAFSGEAAGEWWRKGWIPTCPIQIPDSEMKEWCGLMDILIQQGRRVDSMGRNRASNHMESLILRLADQRGTVGSQMPEWLTPVLVECEDFSCEPDWGKLARSCGMAPTTFRRKFTHAMGSSPKTYRIECRIHRARQLLANPERTLEGIAGELGFSDVFHFTRQFKQKSGIPPAAYRRELLSSGKTSQ